MDTYCQNSDILFDTGRTTDEYFLVDLSPAEVELTKDKVRERAYNFINSKLQGKTAIPSTLPVLRQVEVDLILNSIISDAYTQESLNDSENGEKYLTRAMEVLDNLQFPASTTEPLEANTNTGNGTIAILNLKDSFLRNETFFITAQNATKFSIEGSNLGYIGEATVGDIFPEAGTSSLSGVFSDYGIAGTSYRSIPFSLLITAGTTDFIQGDNFTFKSYAGADLIKCTSGNLLRG